MNEQLLIAQSTADQLLQQKLDVLEDFDQLKDALDTSQQLIDTMEADLEVIIHPSAWYNHLPFLLS